MAATRCEQCGGVEVDHACVCSMDGLITALEEDNSRLRVQLDQVTKLIGEAIECCEVCRGAENPACARCLSFQAWLDAL